MFWNKKAMTEEERLEKEQVKANRRAARARRREKFKDGFAEVGGAMAPIVLPIVALTVASCAASKKSEKKANETLDLLAKGKGYSGRKDPKFVAELYDNEMNKIKNADSANDDEV